jgi:leader peptidase (prepilin peptidase)/N-methyltransferase
VLADDGVLAAVIAVLVCGPAAYILGPWLLRRIPEPVLDEGDSKVLYASLAGPRAALWCGALAAVAGGALGLLLGMDAVLPAWLVLTVAGSVLGYIDARTRFLPSVIIWPTYLVVGLALLVAALASGEWDALRRAVLAGAIGFAVFYLLWFAFPRGVGFGDVRLSGLLGLALGWLGWGEFASGLYGGFFLGAVVGIVLIATRVMTRKQMVPFGPFMLVGALAGVVLGPPLTRLYTG